MRIIALKACSVILAFTTFSHAAGIQIGRTRVIYDASKKEVALSLKNTETELPWLIQSWIDTGDGKTRGPFIVTPPLFRLDPQKEQNLRITWSGQALPTDRESLFYMNVRTIPAMEKSDDQKNVLRLIYKTRLKLFWRPSG
ncbi:MAG: fimbria/pilus periplasmic chaperone, partial [Acinetobacter sp.]